MFNSRQPLTGSPTTTVLDSACPGSVATTSRTFCTHRSGRRFVLVNRGTCSAQTSFAPSSIQASRSLKDWRSQARETIHSEWASDWACLTCLTCLTRLTCWAVWPLCQSPAGPTGLFELAELVARAFSLFFLSCLRSCFLFCATREQPTPLTLQRSQETVAHSL